MSSTKLVDVVILQKFRTRLGDIWKPYQEHGKKPKVSAKDRSCYILAKEGEVFSVQCTNTTKGLLAVRISVDACYIQQYLLHPTGEAGDTVTCHGTRSHSMKFQLVSALTRAGNKHSRPPSETGCISVTVYQPQGSGDGLTPPEKPTEQLELPVSMDGTFWTLCVRLAGNGLVIGEPSPDAAEIGKLRWKLFAKLDFNYRTEDELFSGRIRGIEIPPKQGVTTGTSSFLSLGKRELRSISDSPYKKKIRTQFVLSNSAPTRPWEVRVLATVDDPASSATSSQSEDSTVRVPRSVTRIIEPVSVLSKVPGNPNVHASSGESCPVPPNHEPETDVAMVLSTEPSATSAEPPFIPWPPDNLLRAGSNVPNDPPQQPTSQPSTGSSSGNTPAIPATEPMTGVVSPIPIPTELPQPEAQPQPQTPVVVPTITPPLTPNDNPELEKPTATSTDEADRTVPTLTTFLDGVTLFRPLGFSANDLQKVGISTLTELRIIARKPEAFRTKISVLADLRERDEYLWMMFRKGLKKLLEGDDREQSADNPVPESDPVRRFVRSLSGGRSIDVEALENGLRGVGVSSERDLLVLSRNLEGYTENIPFLREFAASKKFGWVIFQVGLEDLLGRRMIVQTQDHEADVEDCTYIRQFLDSIDPYKPLGHLADGFTKAGLTDRSPLLHVAEDIELALDAMPFLQGLASGDQLVWAMILIGLENLTKSA